MAISTSEILMLIYARDHASNVLRRLRLEMQHTQTMQAKVAAGAALVGRSMSYVAVAGGAAMLASANSFGKFEASMNLLQVASKANAVEMKKLKDTAISLGNDLRLPGVTAQDAAETMTNLSRAGLSVNDVLGATRGTLQLAVAGNVDFASATKISSGILNAFGRRGTEATKIVDMLAAAANSSQAELSDMGLAAQQASSAFARNNQTVADMAASIAILANNGIRGERAGTTLKVMMERLTAPTDKAKKAMDAMGISVYNAQGNVRPMPELIAQFTRATQHMSKEQRDAALHTIFGTRANQAAFFILTQGTGKYEAMRKKVLETGQANALASAKMKGWQGTVEQLMNSLQTLGILLGEQVVPHLTKIVQRITTVVQWYSKLSDSNKKLVANALILVTTFASVASIVAKVVQAVAVLWEPITAVAGAIGTLGGWIGRAALFLLRFIPIILRASGVMRILTIAFTALRAAFAAMMAGTPVGWILLIVAAVIALGIVIYKYRKQIWEFLVDMWNKAKPIVLGAWNAIYNTVKTGVIAVWNVVYSIWSRLRDTTLAAWNQIVQVVTSVSNTIRQVVMTIWHSQIMQVIRNVVITIWQIVKTYWTLVYQIVRTIVLLIWDAVRSYVTLVVNFWRGAFNVISDVASAIWRGISTVIKYFLTFIWGSIQIYLKLVIIYWRFIFTQAWNLIKAVWGGISTTIRVTLTFIRSIITSVLNVIRSVWNTVWTAARNTATIVWAAIWNVIGPTMRTIGSFIRSTVNTIRSTWNTVWAAIRNFAVNTWQAIWRNAVERTAGIRNAVTTFMGNVRNTVTTGMTRVRNFFADTWSRITSGLRGFVSTFSNVFNGIKNAAASPINWVISNVINRFSGAFNSVAKAVGVSTRLPTFAAIKMQRGGPVPGAGIGDKVHAMLEPGEIVIPNIRTARRRVLQSRAFMSKVEELYGGDLSSPGTAAFGMMRYATGGVVAAQNWARGQAGKPYVWGGAGPGGYDCSGFMSAIRNFLVGSPIYRHTFSTASFASGRGASGFVPGINGSFAIGVMQGNPGHMAGTLGGLNVESRGGAGVVIGPRARGANHPLFRQHFHLAQVGGSFIGGGGGIDIVGLITKFINPVMNMVKGIPGFPLLKDILTNASNQLIAGGITKLAGPIGGIVGGVVGAVSRGAGAVGNLLGRLNPFYDGGVIREPILGRGLHSGQGYAFGEGSAIERVSPRGRGSSGWQGDVHIHTQEINPRLQAAQLAWELHFRTA